MHLNSLVATCILCISTATAFAAVQEKTEPHFMPDPGAFSIGVKVVTLYDDSRRFYSKTDDLGQPFTGKPERPIQTLLWYPSEKAAVGAMSVIDYLRIGENEAAGKEPPSERLPVRLLTSFASSKHPLLAHLNAPATARRFPVVVYAPSISAPATENADLCEFLASQGYLVLSSPSRGSSTLSMTDDISGLNAQARDISFLIGYASTLPDADMSEVAVVGYSFGGLANIYAAMQDSRIKALVCLDGSIRYYVTLARDAGIHPEQMTQPLLFFTQGAIALESDLVDALISKGSRSLLRGWTHADLFTYAMSAMDHGAFSSMNERNDSLWEDQQGPMMDGYNRAEVALSYGWVAQYTSTFLNAYLKHDPDALTYLKRTPADNGVQKHLMSLDFRPATGLARTLDSFRAEVGRRGFTHAGEILADARKDDPDYKINEKDMILWGMDGLLEQGHLSEAVEIFKLVVTMYPSSSNAYSSLGEAYRRTGNKTLAVENFRKACELDHFNYFAEYQLKRLQNEGSSVR